MDAAGSGSCSMAVFFISGVEPRDPPTRELVNL